MENRNASRGDTHRFDKCQAPCQRGMALTPVLQYFLVVIHLKKSMRNPGCCCIFVYFNGKNKNAASPQMTRKCGTSKWRIFKNSFFPGRKVILLIKGIPGRAHKESKIFPLIHRALVRHSLSLEEGDRSLGYHSP